MKGNQKSSLIKVELPGSEAIHNAVADGESAVLNFGIRYG